MVSFWLRQDQQSKDLADVVVEVVNDWLLTEWPLASHIFRVLPDERSSCIALERQKLQKIHLVLPGDQRPYVSYQPSG
ncbi:MAG TPA: hypothetical protein VFT75_04720 [Nocardioidaceae bacterium]|nr:hypothetical protein [Nocardioidaceae bacterium]